MIPRSFFDKAVRTAAILFLPVCAGVLGGELGPSSGEPHLWDKALHFTAYFILSALAVAALRARKKALLAMLGLIVMGGALEIIQGMVGRDMSAYDELANTLGVIAGAIMVWAVRAALVRFRPAD
ncbi:MAG TPA: VanZ family protein [Rhizomicrobium sp.]